MVPLRSVTAERDAPDEGATQTAAPEIGAVEVPTITLRVATGGGFTVRTPLLLIPSAVAVIFTNFCEATWLVVTVKVWLLEPPLTCVLDGTEATLALSVDKLTVKPPAGAVDVSVTVA